MNQTYWTFNIFSFKAMWKKPKLKQRYWGIKTLLDDVLTKAFPRPSMCGKHFYLGGEEWQVSIWTSVRDACDATWNSQSCSHNRVERRRRKLKREAWYKFKWELKVSSICGSIKEGKPYKNSKYSYWISGSVRTRVSMKVVITKTRIYVATSLICGSIKEGNPTRIQITHIQLVGVLELGFQWK